MPEYLKLQTVAQALQVSMKTLYSLRNRGEIEFTKIGGATRVAKSELDRYLNANSDRGRAAKASAGACMGA